MFNRIQENIENSFLGNYHGYPTDCPHREKIGWSGDAQLVAATGLYNYHMIPSYLKWIDDFADEQRHDGKVPAIIPTSGWGYTYGTGKNRDHGYGPHWDGAYLNIPWDMYLFTGDTSILRKYYEGLKAYMIYLEESAEDYILNYGIDDHKPVTTRTDGDIISTAYFYDFSVKMLEMAIMLEKEEDKKHYNKLREYIFDAFNDRFWDEKKEVYGNGGQTAMSMALYLDLVPEDKKEKVIFGLLNEIGENNEHIDAGVVGTRFMVKTLPELGYSGILYRIVDQKTYPGWGYWVDKGATTLWQTWQGDMSLNHIMFGSIGEWFYSSLGGIRIDPGNPGFRRIILNPDVTERLEWVNSEYESLYGNIVSQWERGEGYFKWNIEIPVNTSARVYLPVKYGKKILESGNLVKNNAELNIMERNRDYWVLKVLSGNFAFQVRE
jgi:alpha-L-rhamnosidase